MLNRYEPLLCCAEYDRFFAPPAMRIGMYYLFFLYERIFIFQGFLLTLFGLTVGLSAGIVLVLLQKKYSLFMITQHLAYPVEFTYLNVLTVLVTILILGLLASKIASSRISKKIVE